MCSSFSFCSKQYEMAHRWIRECFSPSSHKRRAGENVYTQNPVKIIDSGGGFDRYIWILFMFGKLDGVPLPGTEKRTICHPGWKRSIYLRMFRPLLWAWGDGEVWTEGFLPAGTDATMQKSINWMSSGNSDDRVITCLLEIQARGDTQPACLFCAWHCSIIGF